MFAMNGWRFLNLAMASSTKPIILPVSGNYNIAIEDIQFIKYTLAGILISALGFVGKWVVSLFFKKQDSVDMRLDTVIEALTRLESNVGYLERHTVKKEDLLLVIRQEIQYRDSIR